MEKISWNNPTFGEREVELVTEVLKSGYVSEGPKTKELEENLSKIVNAKHVIMTTNATAALYLAIEADKRIRNYTEGDVIIPAVTFLATKNAVELAGLNPKIVDVVEDTFLLNELNNLGLIGELPKIVIPVNLLGRKTKKTIDIEHNQYTTIYDNAGCLGSNVPNGKVGCYSLQANKMINCGQGGFCATDDDEYAKEIRKIKDFGREDKYDNRTIGFNFKFNDILAAVTLGQLEQLEERKMLHATQYCVYHQELGELGKFINFNIRFMKDENTKKYRTTWEVPLWVEFITDKRDELYNYLKDKGIECRKPWQSLSDDCPNAVYYEKNCLWLPNGSSLTKEQQDYVIKCIKEFFIPKGL